MDKREVVKLALDHKEVPYVPWECGFNKGAKDKLHKHFCVENLEQILDNHFLGVGYGLDSFANLGNNRFRDRFGAIWNRTVDKDIGVVEGHVLPNPELGKYEFPDPTDSKHFAAIPAKIAAHSDRFRIFDVGFSLYERAWILRGMENLLMDFMANPDFAHELLDAIADYNVAHIKEALKYDFDAIGFGDDWGSETGLQMGPQIWHEFIFPQLKRMYSVVQESGRYVIIHSCGKVDELFDDLVEIGLDCFNPFQPEVMDVFSLMKEYKGRLAFNGGLSVQQTLPYGSIDDVRKETSRLLEAGKSGGYIFSPAHSVTEDVPLENMLVFIDMLHEQNGYNPGGRAVNM